MVKNLNKIKEIRMQYKKTQKWLADILGVSQTAVALWENGSREPSKEIIEKIAELFNVSPAYLMGWGVPKDLIYIGNGFYGKEAPAEMQEKFLNRINSKKTKILEKIDQLNDEGQSKALDHVELLTKIPEYRKETQENKE